MALFGTNAASAGLNTTTGDISKDVALTNPPDDSISDICFSPQTEHLAVASWDKKVRIYEILAQGVSEGKALYEHEQPVLSCCWSKVSSPIVSIEKSPILRSNPQDGTKVVSGGADKAARMLDLNSGQNVGTQVAAHDQAVRCVRFVEVPGQATPVLVTGSWDKTIKYWDLRQATPVGSVSCQERVYSMDVINKLLVVATADRYINIINLDKPMEFYKTMQSPLKWQTRVVSCFTDASGFAVGSIEGRCAIQYVEEKDSR